MEVPDLVRSFCLPSDGALPVGSTIRAPWASSTRLSPCRTPRYLRRQPALVKASVITAGLSWTCSSIVRVGKYDSDQIRPLRAPPRLRGLMLVSISPPWCPLNATRDSISQVTRLPASSVKGLNYQVLDVNPGPLTLRGDEECTLNYLTPLGSATGPHKLCSSLTEAVTDTQKLPVHRASKRSPSTVKPARAHPELLGNLETLRATEPPSMPKSTARTSIPSIAVHSLSPPLLLGTSITRARRRFAPPSKEMLQLLVETELALLPTEALPGSPRIQHPKGHGSPRHGSPRHGSPPSEQSQRILAPSSTNLDAYPPLSYAVGRMKGSKSRATPTIPQRHINATGLCLSPGTHHDAKSEPPLVTPAEARVACAKWPSSRFVHDYRLEYTHLPSILQTTIRTKAPTPLVISGN